ncbi:hypothetical protein LX32DRAFT_733958 [Colletotrichum zoysiae]|uniref:FHA domain-containing protein n=1 Tax=Colletotrichum zoysiae TaxID=1216348 RepID=A0AAD9H2G3_9PEZI|nr:hypothetical protein LX32DRAFT_733958 [Colletotrichum zoysiae]
MDTMLGDFEDQYAIRVRVPDPLVFDAISKDTQGGTLCTVHRFGSTTVVEESSSTPDPETEPSGGVLLFSGPKSLHEKLGAKVPDGFVAGRLKKLNDLVFANFGQISRHHFVIGLYKNQWVVFNLSRNGTWVNNDYLHGERSMLALHPEKENEIRLGSPPLSLFIRCQHPSTVKLNELWPNHDTLFSETDDSSQTTIAAAQHRSGLGSDSPRIYYLKDHKLPSRTKVPKILALDARSCDLFVAKAYPVTEKDRLLSRMDLLQQLPQTSCGPFLQDHVLIVAEDVVYSLVPYLATVETLQAVSEFAKESKKIKDRYSLARQLLRNLIKAVSMLHEQYKISHGDLCLQTVFSESVYDCQQLFISGFSAVARLTPARAKSDCLAIFNTVREFLQDEPEQGWFAVELLDSVWKEFTSLRNKKDWSYTVVQLCDMFDLRLNGEDTLWRRLTISKDVIVRYQCDGKLVSYHTGDIQTFASLAAVKSAIADPEAARKNVNIASSLLRRYAQEKGNGDYISSDGFDAFSLQMAKNHAIHLCLDHLPDSGQSQKSMSSLFMVASVSFKIPYHTRHGWINLSSLGLLAPADSPLFQGIVEQCHEVRGHCSGFYVAINNHLETLAQHLGFRYSSEEIVNHEDKKLEHYTRANGWFILSPHESADLVPVERASEMVWGRQPLGPFLKSHMPHNPYDAMINLDPKDLFVAQVEISTYDGTVESSNDPLAFSFSRERKPTLNSGAEKASQWLKTNEFNAGRRRKNSNMIRTNFHPT